MDDASVYVDASERGDHVGIGWKLTEWRGPDHPKVDGNRRKLATVSLDGRGIRGNYTSVEAEFMAMLEGLRTARRSLSGPRAPERRLTVYSDCKPLTDSINDAISEEITDEHGHRKYSVPTCEDNAELIETYERVFSVLHGSFKHVSVNWLTRESNTEADREATIAADRLEQ